MSTKCPRTVAAALDDLVYRFTLGTMGGSLLMAAVSSLYLVKSAVGIDLMDGPSPLHFLFY
jgi:hypothetical protein